VRATMQSCVFCRIVSGEIPGDVIGEDDRTLAFLDVGPVAEGHALVIPKPHVGSLLEADAATGAALFAAMQRVIDAMTRAFGADGVNILINQGRCAGQVVEHLHVHVIPRREGDGLALLNWHPQETSPERRAALARRLRTEADDAGA